MSKSKSTDIFRHGSAVVNPWDQAIADAEKVIETAVSKITQMKRAIRAFKAMRDAGEPWPGTSGETGAVTSGDRASKGTG